MERKGGWDQSRDREYLNRQKKEIAGEKEEGSWAKRQLDKVEMRKGITSMFNRKEIWG